MCDEPVWSVLSLNGSDLLRIPPDLLPNGWNRIVLVKGGSMPVLTRVWPDFDQTLTLVKIQTTLVCFTLEWICFAPYASGSASKGLEVDLYQFWMGLAGLRSNVYFSQNLNFNGFFCQRFAIFYPQQAQVCLGTPMLRFCSLHLD